jgi:Tol biopolymer transport system component
MKRLVALFVAAGMTWLGVVGVGASAQAVVPGANGRILFTRAICFSDARRCWEIVAADPNGTHETLIAGPYRRRVWDDHFIANWSPDGMSVIFMANQGIWQVNADGAGLHELFHAPCNGDESSPDPGCIDDGPAFTPDGRYIIFTRCCPKPSGYGLWRINADGSRLRVVTREVAGGPNVDAPSDNLPQVSPDGERIAYHRNVVTCSDPNECGNRIVTVNIHGGNRVQLTDPSIDAQIPNWSPDSRRIVFEMYPPDDGVEIGIVNADGTGFRQLTFGNEEIFSFAPSFSPDGTRIIFSRAPSTNGVDLFTMNPDGSGVTQVTRTASIELWPQWAAAS